MIRITLLLVPSNWIHCSQSSTLSNILSCLTNARHCNWASIMVVSVVLPFAAGASQTNENDSKLPAFTSSMDIVLTRSSRRDRAWADAECDKLSLVLAVCRREILYSYYCRGRKKFSRRKRIIMTHEVECNVKRSQKYGMTTVYEGHVEIDHKLWFGAFWLILLFRARHECPTFDVVSLQYNRKMPTSQTTKKWVYVLSKLWFVASFLQSRHRQHL